MYFIKFNIDTYMYGSLKSIILFQIKGPFWEVPTGRRDGRESVASETRDLPPPFGNITLLKQKFAAKGLSVKDLVVLSGNPKFVTYAFLDKRFVKRL